MKLMMIAAAMLAATPAMAQDNSGFVGPRVEATAGYNDINNSRDTNNVVYGGAIGVDVPLGTNFTIGAEANTSNVFERERQIGGAARLGYAFTPTTLVYAKGGYNTYRDDYTVGKKSFTRNLDGYVVGGGVEHKLSQHTFAKAEYRYSDFGHNVSDSAVVAGFGLRF